MSSERETCGLGSIIPMSCRGRAEAFARRLQSRLQTLGRSGSGLDESADESSWIGRQSSITSCQPRLSSSSDSDIFFDFDLDTSGSPEEEVPPSSTSRHQISHDIDSGSALSLSTTERTSPVSEESSDERYFDPECSDCESSKSEVSNECKHKHKPLVSSDGSKNSNFTVLCNGHIADSGTENSNLRSKDDFNLNTTSMTERYNKINVARLEKLSIGDNNQAVEDCSCSNNYDDSTVENSPTNHKHVNMVSDSDGKDTMQNSPEGSAHKTDDYLQNTGAFESAITSKIENEDIMSNSTICVNVSDVENHSLSVCLCTAKSDEDTNSKTHPVSESSNVLTLLNDDSAFSQINDDHELDLCCSTFNRPKNLLIDCATLSSDIEQLSVLVPLRIDSPENSAPEEAAEAVSNSSVDIESQKHADEDTCDDDVDDDEDEDRPRRIRRSSSLKSGKTPPGTPGRKKIVRFADVLGLDLADIRTFLDEVPWVPQSAYQDLQNADLSEPAQNNVSGGIASCTRRSEKCLVPMFQQPGNHAEFLDRVRERQVCLESAIVTDTIFFTISGVVRVRNLDFHKSVYVRYTLDGWKNFSDLKASYIDGSCDGFSDKFSFRLYAHTVTVGSKVEFAVRFQCRGVQYWDNNLGANYTFQCLPPIAPCVTSLPLVSPVDETWTASFY